MSYAIDLPWPPAALSPHARNHWRILAKAKADYRQRCAVYASLDRLKLGAELIPVSIVFHPPDRRSYDLDNLHARIKAGLDGKCDALGCNDKQFRPVTVDIGERVKDGIVRVTLLRSGDARVDGGFPLGDRAFGSLGQLRKRGAERPLAKAPAKAAHGLRADASARGELLPGLVGNEAAHQ